MSETDPTTSAQAEAAQRILIVDDYPTLLLLMDETLSAAGYSVVSATNGAETVAKCLEVRPDLVLLNVEIPDMDGFSACAAIRRDAGAMSESA